MSEEIPDCLLLLQKFAGLFRAPKHVQQAYLENPALHKRLSSLGGKAPRVKKNLPPPKAKPMKQMTFDKTLDEVPHEEGLKMIQDLKRRIGNKEGMFKEAYVKFKGTPNFYKNVLRQLKGDRLGKDLLVGSLLGFGSGYYSTRNAKQKLLKGLNDKPGKTKKEKEKLKKLKEKYEKISPTQNAFIAAGLGAGAFGFIGHTGLDARLRFKNFERRFSGSSASHWRSTPAVSRHGIEKAKSFFGIGNAKTKAEAKKVYKDFARKHHPDLGGDEHKMKEVNNHWDTVEASDWFNKLAFEKILGGYGIDKQAAGIHRLGKSVRFFRGPKAAKNMGRVFETQGAIKSVLALMKRNMSPEEYKETLNKLKKDFSEKAIGTIGTGRKGSKSYINYDKLKRIGVEDKSIPKPRQSVRNVVTHEKWHAEHPILGHSEFLAHLVGGLNQDKGRINIGQGLHDAFVHFPGSRPDRAAIEFGGAGLGAAGLALGGREIYERVKKPEEKGEIVKVSKSQILRDLLEAKKLSDDRDYIRKNEIIRKIVTKYPKQFKVDSHLNRSYVGLTHTPTGFKIHAQKSGLPSEIFNN